MTRAKVAVLLPATASVLSFIAALAPVLRGEQTNGVFLGTGVVFLVIAVAWAKKASTPSKGPPST